VRIGEGGGGGMGNKKKLKIDEKIKAQK